MNILFLFVWLPHLSEENNIFSSLIHEFKHQGHNVLVSSRDQSGRKSSEVVEENGVKVLRVVSHPFTGVANPIKKALAYQEYCIKQRHLIKKFFGNEKIDLVISHSLPPELAWVIRGVKKQFKCPFYLIQTDFLWQDAVAFDYFRRNNPICWYYRFWENRMMKLANYIGCPTKGNIDFILKEYPNMNKDNFQLLPFWQKPTDNVLPDVSVKARDPKLKDKFIVVYGGSIGATQRIEHMIELAEVCKNERGIVFLILGKGAYLPVIKQMAEEKKLDNVVFKEFLPQKEYLALLATCDVGMIILHEKMATPNFPSKSLSYFNMKVPILAALDYSTDFGDYLVEHNAGLWAHSDDIPALKDKLMLYYNDRKLLDEIKNNAYKLYIENLQPKHACEKILKFIKKQ